MCLAITEGHRCTRNVDSIFHLVFSPGKKAKLFSMILRIKRENRGQHLDRLIILIKALSEVMYFLTYVQKLVISN